LETGKETLAPYFMVMVGQPGTSFDTSVNLVNPAMIESVEYELADNIADMATVVVRNPDLVLNNSKMFAPGNEMEIWMGYGASLPTYIGRVVITRPEPNFPRDQMPTITVKGYTKDHSMMVNAPEKGVKRRHKNKTFSQAVGDKAREYNMETDIEDVDFKPRDLFQKVGMTDYEFVRGIANFTGFLFWVDWDVSISSWVLHFKDPARISVQDKVYTFRYNQGDLSTLLEFNMQMALRDALTKVTIEVSDGKGHVFKDTIEDNANQPDVLYTGNPKDEKITQTYTTGGAIKLFFGEHSIDIPSKAHINNAADLKMYVSKWFADNRANFIIGDGTVIGLESLACRQRHILSGLGVAYDGKYEFTKVTHKQSLDGYFCTFSARKIIEGALGA
jgi:hypothetical protein